MTELEQLKEENRRLRDENESLRAQCFGWEKNQDYWFDETRRAEAQVEKLTKRVKELEQKLEDLYYEGMGEDL